MRIKRRWWLYDWERPVEWAKAQNAWKTALQDGRVAEDAHATVVRSMQREAAEIGVPVPSKETLTAWVHQWWRPRVVLPEPSREYQPAPRIGAMPRVIGPLDDEEWAEKPDA
jgi:hypothetical protein